MNIKKLISIISLLLYFPVYAQNFRIKVLDNKKNVEAAHIVLNNAIEAITDSNGETVITEGKIKAGDNLSVMFVGYEGVTKNITDKNITDGGITINIKESSLNINEILVKPQNDTALLYKYMSPKMRYYPMPHKLSFETSDTVFTDKQKSPVLITSSGIINKKNASGDYKGDKMTGSIKYINSKNKVVDKKGRLLFFMLEKGVGALSNIIVKSLDAIVNRSEDLTYKYIDTHDKSDRYHVFLFYLNREIENTWVTGKLYINKKDGYIDMIEAFARRKEKEKDGFFNIEVHFVPVNIGGVLLKTSKESFYYINKSDKSINKIIDFTAKFRYLKQ